MKPHVLKNQGQQDFGSESGRAGSHFAALERDSLTAQTQKKRSHLLRSEAGFGAPCIGDSSALVNSVCAEYDLCDILKPKQAIARSTTGATQRR